MTRVQYANHRGVSREAVRKAIRDGRIHTDARGRIEWLKADAAWAANTDPATGVAPTTLPPEVATLAGAKPLPRMLGPDGRPFEITYANARAMHEYFKAQLAELELGERSGKLIPREEIDDVLTRVFRSARDAILAIPDRVGDDLAVIDDPNELRRRLREELERVCVAMASATGGQSAEASA